MLTSDEAITVGVQKYRELYPAGTIPLARADLGGLRATPGQRTVSVYVTYSIRGQREPFFLFKALVERVTGEAIVETAADWHELTRMDLDNAIGSPGAGFAN